MIGSLPENSRDDMLSYLDNYIIKYYVSPEAKFAPPLWNYYDQVSKYGAFNTTTNCCEGINRVLKQLCPSGYISLHTACRKLKSFKETNISNFVRKVKGNRMNPRSKETREREEKLMSIMFDFDQQTENEKFFNLPEYCARFGTANPNLELIVSLDENNTLHITMEQTMEPIFYGPEPEPELLETVTTENENVLRVM